MWSKYRIGQRSGPGVSIALMAKQTTVTVTDDLDGSANAKEVTFIFGLDIIRGGGLARRMLSQQRRECWCEQGAASRSGGVGA